MELEEKRFQDEPVRNTFHRLGRVTIDNNLMSALKASPSILRKGSLEEKTLQCIKHFFNNIIVLDVQHIFSLDVIIYTVASDLFEEVKRGDTIPEYRMALDSSANDGSCKIVVKKIV